MKKGFTLIELMAAVIILATIALIAVPLVEQTLLEINQDAYKTQIKSIREGARQWGAENMTVLPVNNGDTYVLTLGTLKTEGFVKKDIVDPLTKELFLDTLQITIMNNLGNYVYLVGSEADGQINANAPRITLNGDPLVYVNMNTAYVEPGVTATTGTGSPLGSYTTEIKRGSTVVGSVDTTGLYVYIITYSVTDQGITSKTARTVIVRDTVAPVMVVSPTTATIANTVTTYNIMSGVSASDNSGEAVIIRSSTNLTLGIPGIYIITYTGTDTSGNTATATRTVTITY
jgi:prepilin-type N-terminal cleavage/methylation domain-containing protein